MNEQTHSFLKRITLFSIGLLVVQCALLVYSFFFSFDISDEGYHLYLHQHGLSETSTLIGAHYMTHLLGTLFSHKLVLYRLATLVLFLLGSFELTRGFYLYTEGKFQRKNPESWITFCLIAILSTGFFIYLPSLDYNAVGIIAAYFWAALMLRHLANPSTKIAALIGLICFVCFLSKFTFGIAIFINTVFLLALFSNKKLQHITAASTAFILMLLFLCLTQIEFIDRAAQLLAFQQTTENNYQATTLVSRYIKNLKKIIFDLQFFVYFSLLLVIFKKKISNTSFIVQKRYLLLSVFVAISALFCLTFARDFNLLRFRSILSRFTLETLMGIITISYFTYAYYKIKTNHLKHVLMIGYLVLCAAWFSTLGTNTSIVYRATLGLGLFGLLLVVILKDLTHNYTQGKYFVITALICTSLVTMYCTTRDQLLYPYRNAPYLQQTTYSKHSPYLRWIKMEENHVHIIDNLIEALQKSSFDFTNDRIFAYTDLPGFVSAAGVKAFASPWLITKYKNSTQRMCKLIDFEPINKNIRNVYVLHNRPEPMNDTVKKCLFEKVQDNKDAKTIHLGNFFHYRNEYNNDVTLTGPYKLK